MLKNVFAAVVAASLCTASLSFSAFSEAEKASADDTVKIMCVGDSITDGYGISGSYRKFLYHNLTEKGYNIDMVGSKDGGWNPTYTDESGVTFSYDNENTGYSGYSIKQYPGRSGILETLQSTNCLSQTSPDIVILQIGTNDVIDNYEIMSAGERLTELITYILGEIPSDSALFVTTIPDLDPNRSEVYNWFSNYRHSPDWQTQYSDDVAEANIMAALSYYDNSVYNNVSKLQEKYPNLYYGNVRSVITDVKTQLADGVHPNNTGYKLMGDYWTEVISNYLSGSSGTVTTTETTTSETTTTTTTTETTTTVTTTTAVTASEPVATFTDGARSRLKEIKTMPTKTVYTEGEELDLTGLTYTIETSYHIIAVDGSFSRTVTKSYEDSFVDSPYIEISVYDAVYDKTYDSSEFSTLPAGEYVVKVPIRMVMDNYTVSVPVTIVKAEEKVVFGDANCDSDINIADTVIILQSISNPDAFGVYGSNPTHITEQGMKNADCSNVGDGVTGSDALAIQKLSLGLIKVLPE